MAQLPLESRLVRYRIMVENACEDDAVRGALESWDYNLDVLPDLLALLDEVEQSHRLFKYTRQMGMGSTADFQEIWEDAKDAYNPLVKVARKLIKEPAIRGLLRINGSRFRDFARWSLQAMDFYDNALADDDIWKLLKKKGGVKKTKLEQGRDLVHEAFGARKEQTVNKGLAQMSTTERNAKIEELDDLMGAFRAVLEAATDEEPRMLAKVGLTVRTS